MIPSSTRERIQSPTDRGRMDSCTNHQYLCYARSHLRCGRFRNSSGDFHSAGSGTMK